MTTVLITGAGSGLNKGAAFELVKRGYEVIACVEIYPQVRELEIQAKERGVNLRIEKIDVTKEGDRRRAMSWDIDGESSLFRNVVTPDVAAGVSEGLDADERGRSRYSSRTCAEVL